MRSFSTSKRFALLAASAIGLMFATAASAQDYGPYDDAPPPPAYGPTEEVTVIAPPYYQERSRTTGAPIRDVAMSREIRFDDLDLTSDWGARALEQRVKYSARDMCRKLDQLYPISATDSPPCYETAVNNAMAQADEAISRARGSY
jgi:UrcA family protein